MGILNLTPDSFYDQGKYYAPAQALGHAQDMFKQGADIIDLGAESTRPFAEAVSTEEEMRRLEPVLAGLAELWPERTGPAISIDTRRGRVAQAALAAGAHIINDVSACSFDPALPEVLAHYRPGYVLMHSQGQPENMQTHPHYDNIIPELMTFFEKHLSRLVKAGLPEDHIVLDPGIGFGKTLTHNLEILRNIDALKSLGRPVLLGLSNKSFLGRLLDLDLTERGPATQAITALMATHGVAVHRVHDVHSANLIRELLRALG